MQLCVVSVLVVLFVSKGWMQDMGYRERLISCGEDLCILLQCFLMLSCCNSVASSIFYATTIIPQFTTLLAHGQVTIIFVVSVCLSVCLFVCAEFFSAVFDPISIKLGHMLYVWVYLCPLEYRGCATPGGWMTLKKLVFLGVLGLKKLSRPTVLIVLS